MILHQIIQKIVKKYVVRDELGVADKMEQKTPEGSIILQKILPISLSILIFPVIFGFMLLDMHFKNELTGEILLEASPFLLFPMMTLIGLICFFNCRTYYDNEGFTVKNFFGFKRRYSYQEIQKVTYGNHMLHLHLNQRKVHILFSCNGSQCFLSFLYGKGTFAIEEVQPKKTFDIFNGNVKDPMALILPFSMVGIFLFLMMIIAAICAKPYNPDHLKPEYVCFVRYEIEEETGDLLLYQAHHSTPYRLPHFREILPEPNAFLDSIKGFSGHTVRLIYYTDVEYYEIFSIYHDGTDYLTLEQWHQYYDAQYRNVFLIFGSLLLFWFIFCSFIIYVGRHPEKFSRRFVNHFIQDSYIVKKDQTSKK